MNTSSGLSLSSCEVVVIKTDQVPEQDLRYEGGRTSRTLNTLLLDADVKEMTFEPLFLR